MTSSALAVSSAFENLQRLAPGLVLAGSVAVLGTWMQPLLPKALPLPAMVLSLLLGILLHSTANNALFQPGLHFCVKSLLRWAVALLGLRIAVGDILDLGFGVAILVMVAMAGTMAAALLLARLLGQSPMYAALAGAATAVCGASAALATSTVVPYYRGKDTDVAFVVIGVNLLATVAMLVYPLICHWLGFSDRAIGIMLGGTIHDVAQVVGSGYAISDNAGNAAVIVKLFRVFLLLPVVLSVGWYFTRSGYRSGEAKVPLPTFAFGFLALCIVNSVVPSIPALVPIFEPVKAGLGTLSTWGLLLAIAALGLGTSFRSFAALGWRHIATLVATAAVILVIMTGGLMVLG